MISIEQVNIFLQQQYDYERSQLIKKHEIKEKFKVQTTWKSIIANKSLHKSHSICFVFSLFFLNKSSMTSYSLKTSNEFSSQQSTPTSQKSLLVFPHEWIYCFLFSQFKSSLQPIYIIFFFYFFKLKTLHLLLYILFI